MRRNLVFNFRANDSLFIPAGTTTPAGSEFSFFKDCTQLNEDDISALDEAQIMSFILGSDRDMILSELGADDANSFIKCGVTQPVITDPSKKPGDIDLLICDGGRPHEAIAIQCKRVKIRANQRI